MKEKRVKRKNKKKKKKDGERALEALRVSGTLSMNPQYKFHMWVIE